MITRDQLSEEQELALQHMIAFTKGTERQMLLGGYAGTGKCLDGSNIIWTSTGLKRLKSLSDHSHTPDTAIKCDLDILSFNESTKRICNEKATQVWRDAKPYGVNFTLSKGYSHKVSTWHPIYCSIDGDIAYHTSSTIMSALDNNCDVWVPIVQGHPNLVNSNYVTVSTMRGDIKITENIAYIIGSLVGDGSLTNSTLNQTRFSNIDSDIIEAMRVAAKDDGIEFELDQISNTTCDWYLRSPRIVDLIRYFGLNVTSDLKYIPDDIIASPKSVIAAFLSGLFDTDGSSDKRDGYIEYCTSSTRLSEDVQSVLLAFGIISRRKFRQNKCKGAYHIYIRGINARKFYDVVGFKCKRKQDRLNILADVHNQNDHLYPPQISSLMEDAFKSRFDRIDSDEPALERVGSWYKNNNKLSNYYVDYYQGRRTPSREKLLEFINDTNAHELSELTFYTDDEKIWLRVESYDLSPMDLFDLVVPETHAFLANGVINHNTTLVKVFLEHVKSRTHFVCTCTAPTNEAVRVIAKATGEKYDKTIYSLLGLALVHEDDTKPRLKPQGKSKLEEYDIVVIDESSMIDSDIFDIIQQQLNAHSYIKIIYVGDDAQLPPIIDVQNYNRTKSRVFDIKNQVILREVQRVAKGNPIIDIVTPIRNNLTSNQDHFERKTILNDNHGVVFHDSRDEFMELLFDDFTSESYKNDSNFVRGIAYTNRAIDAMNIHIRRKLFNTKDLNEYMIGENLIVDSPVVEKITSKVSKIVYSVGERLRVLFVNQFKDSEYGYRVWELRVVNYEEASDDQVTRTLRVIHKDDMDYYDAALTELAQLSKEKELKMMNGKDGKPRPMYTKFEAWKDYFAFKDQYSWVKYSYAMTTHKCVHPDTIINGNNRSFRMSSIFPNIHVMSDANHNDVVNYKSIMSHNKYAIVTLATGQVLKCGIDHPVKVFDGVAYSYINASNLSTEDYVCVQLGNSSDSYEYVNEFPAFIPNNVDIESSRFTQFTEELAWVFGALIGDGCYVYKSNRVDYTAPADIDLLEKMFRVLHDHGMNPRYLYRNKKPYTVMVESINFRNILSHFGFGHELGPDKKLYEPLLNLPDYYMRYVLQGLFDADGNVQIDRNKVRFTSASHQLVSDIQVMLLRYGIPSSVYTQNPKHHTLNISGKYVKQFRDKIGFSSIRNINKLDQIRPISKTDSDIIPGGIHLIELFISAYTDKYGNTRGRSGVGLNSPSLRHIGCKCSAIINGTLKLSRNMFDELRELLHNENISIPEFDMIHTQNYFYSPVKSVQIINDPIELMEIEVGNRHTYVANGIATHNSQGSTVERVYVVERDLNKLSWNDEERNKLKYVAFTRASHILRILQ